MDSKGVVVAIISDTMKKNKNWVYGLKREDEKLCIKEHWNSKSGGKLTYVRHCDWFRVMSLKFLFLSLVTILHPSVPNIRIILKNKALIMSIVLAGSSLK